MKTNQANNDSEYYKRLTILSEQQQAKIAVIVAENTKVIMEFSAEKQVEKMELDVNSLMVHLHSEIEKTMTDVNQKMKDIQAQY